MYNVLHIMDAADGGISKVVLNIYENINRDCVHFDIASTVKNTGNNLCRLKALGAEVYYLPLKSRNLSQYTKAIEDILRNKHYDAVHVHENETSYVALQVAKKVGIKKRIAHAHTTAPTLGIKSELRRLSGCLLNYMFATNVIGCGQLAGERVFGKKHMKSVKACVLPNAIDTSSFLFSKETRDQMRRELGVADKFVIGMVGRLSQQKNYNFAVNTMKEYCVKHPNTVLLIVGSGEDEEKLQQKITQNKMENNIILLGQRTDVNRIYMAFDLFLMTSLYEGFPLAGVEAVCSGLPVILSDTITRELAMFKNVIYLPLSKSEKWVSAISSTVVNSDRAHSVKIVRDRGFDILDVGKQMERLYLS